MMKFLPIDVPIGVKGVFLSALFTLAAGASAVPAYARSIATDRVWLVDLDLTQTYSYAAKFAFDGTRESDGNFYDCLTLTELYSYDRWHVHTPNDGDKGITFNLREADGVVYMQTPEGWNIWNIDGVEIGNELQLFDFNAGAGDTYMSVGTNGYMVMKGDYGYQCLVPIEVHVASVDSVEIDGRSVCRQFIDKITVPGRESESFDDEPIQVIETIGIVNHGYPMAFTSTATGSFWFSYLNLAECVKSDGEVLYKAEDVVIPAATKVQPAGHGIAEFCTSPEEGTYVLWTLGGTSVDDNTVEMKLCNFHKWKREGEDVCILEPTVPSPEKSVGQLINDGHKTSLRVSGADGNVAEYPLYDFSKSRAEKFQSVMAEIEYEGDMPVLKSLTSIECKIGGVDYWTWEKGWNNESIGKCQHITEVYVPSTGETIRGENGEALFSLLQGVGNVDYPIVYVRNGGNLKMNKVSDSEGSRMLLGENLTVPRPGHKPVKLIREGREWEYVSYDTWGRYEIYWRMKFDGTEERNGRTYHRLVTFKTTQVINHWEEKDDGSIVNSYTVKVDETPSDVKLLREENSKVYLLYDGGINEFYNYPLYWNKSDADSQELRLYDFSQQAGDMVQGCSEESAATGFFVSDTETCTIEGEECTVQNYNQSDYELFYGYLGDYPVYPLFDYKMIEGIGFDGWGTLTYIPVAVTTNGEPNFAINNVYNSQGEVIYEGVGTVVPTEDYDGVSLTEADRGYVRLIAGAIEARGMTSVTVYALDGREVYSAYPGGDIIIPTEGWAKGTYVIKATGRSGSRTIKMII